MAITAAELTPDTLTAYAAQFSLTTSERGEQTASLARHIVSGVLGLCRMLDTGPVAEFERVMESMGDQLAEVGLWVQSVVAGMQLRETFEENGVHPLGAETALLYRKHSFTAEKQLQTALQDFSVSSQEFKVKVLTVRAKLQEEAALIAAQIAETRKQLNNYLKAREKTSQVQASVVDSQFQGEAVSALSSTQNYLEVQLASFVNKEGQIREQLTNLETILLLLGGNQQTVGQMMRNSDLPPVQLKLRQLQDLRLM